MNNLAILLICLTFLINVQSNSVFKIKLDRILIAKEDKEFVSGKMWITKLNRYTNAANGYINILKEAPLVTKVTIQVFEFMHNEYRPFAINVERQLCYFLEQEYKTFFYPDFIKVDGIMPEPKCPIHKGNYSFTNYTVNDENFPVTLPFNNIKLEIGFWRQNNILLLIQAFATFDRDAVIRERFT